jgi:hypothetical protein
MYFSIIIYIGVSELNKNKYKTNANNQFNEPIHY